MRNTSPTIRQVAEACGVSPMTVSFVLNNRKGQVGEETRERVLRVVREMGYRPRAADRAARRQADTLGIVCGIEGKTFAVPGYYNEILHGILSVTERLGRHITMFATALFYTDPHQSIRTYCDGRCDGLMVLAPAIGNPLVAALRERGFPCVLVGDTGDDPGVSCVDIDNVDAGGEITRRLLALGHRRVAFIGGPDFVRSAVQREDGYRRAMSEEGLRPVVSREDMTFSISERDRIRRFLEVEMGRPASERPTALACWNDRVAYSALEILKGLGMSAPQDVSVIGIDDDPRSQFLDAPLTTLRQPYDRIGERAVSILSDQIEGRLEPQRELLPARLIERASDGPPPR